MPWQEVSTVDLREEFVTVASQEGATVRARCRAYGISPKTGYKWLARYREAGRDGLADRARRPHRSPTRTAEATEERVVALRTRHPTWGGRKLRRRLQDQGAEEVPAASTITAILGRHGQLDPAEGAKHTAWRRFEHAAPNELWQMDFKGHFAIGTGRCHPLQVLDDHSRFMLGLVACADEQTPTVRTQLTALFRRYGLPQRILTDNGPPWGAPQPEARLTQLGVWLLRLGVALWHGRVFHPQTQGKVERVGRTLGAEVLGDDRYADLAACQIAFDAWRATYNLERPHEALGLATPASRYRPSARAFPAAPPPIAYEPDDIVRIVHGGGQISYRNRLYFVSQALRGEPVALRPTLTDGVLSVHYCHQQVGQLDLRQPADE